MFPFENVSELAGAYERRNIRSPLKPISITPAHRSAPAHSIFVPLRSHALLSLRANPGTIPFCDEQWRNTNLDRIHTSETLIAKYQLAIADGPARRTASWPSRRTQRRTLCVINSLVVRTKLTTHYTKLKEAYVPNAAASAARETAWMRPTDTHIWRLYFTLRYIKSPHSVLNILCDGLFSSLNWFLVSHMLFEGYV